jgi:hypothetical protein
MVGLTECEVIMICRQRVSVFMAVLLAVGISSAVRGQSSKDANSVSNSPMTFVPGILSQQANALGQRLKAPGKERTVYSGQLFDKGWQVLSRPGDPSIAGIGSVGGF